MPRTGGSVPEKPGRNSLGEAMRAVGPYLNLGWTFAATVAVGTFLGWWLDRKLGTRPWLLLGGIFLGIGAAFVSFLKVTMPGKGNGEEE